MQVRTYTTKANAVRALKGILSCDQVPTNLIRHLDGKFRISMEEVDDFLSLYAPKKTAGVDVSTKQLVEQIKKEAAQNPAPEGAPIVKPYVRAKQIVCAMSAKGASRKEIIAACLAEGIKYNTADNAHYTIIVCKN